MAIINMLIYVTNNILIPILFLLLPGFPGICTIHIQPDIGAGYTWSVILQLLNPAQSAIISVISIWSGLALNTHVCLSSVIIITFFGVACVACVTFVVNANLPMPICQYQSANANMPMPICQCQSANANLPIPICQCQSANANLPICQSANLPICQSKLN